MGRGLGRPLLRLGLTEDVSVKVSAASVDDVGNLGDSEGHVGETGGETSSVRSASRPSRSDVT